MSMHVPHGRWLVWLTFILAILFQIMPVPDIAEPWRPDWMLLAVVYWTMALPHRYNILSAWTLGAILDVLLGAHLGIRALAISLVIYVVAQHFQRLRNFPIWQQTLMVAALVCVYHLLVFWIQFVVSEARFDINLLLPALSSLVIWPWVFWTLRRIRRKYKVR